MDFVILDLEWNATYSKRSKKFVNEIIEFGAVRFNDKLNITDEFSMLIKPQIGKKISDKVQELTHITTDVISDATSTFNHVFSKFKKFAENSVLLSWGTADILALIENNKYYNKKSTLPFLEKYMDLQYYCENQLGLYNPAKQMGLVNAASLVGVQFEENSLHRALEDSKLSFECFKALYKKSELSKFIKIADAEFYKEVTFKNTWLTDLNSPLIDKSTLYVCCGICNKKAKQLTKWEARNKSFRAVFYCSNCHKKLTGAIKYKLKYSGVEVKRNVSFINQNTNNQENTTQ